MKKLFIVCLLLITSAVNSILSQTEVQLLVQKGIQQHDQGQFQTAIEIYEKALALDPINSTVHYEMAYSYSSLKEYDKAIKHCDIALKQKDADHTMAYITKASCINKKGLPKKAIKVYEKGIKKTGSNYLIHYNLALTYFQIEKYDKSSEHALIALDNNQEHASSHLLLAYSQMALGNKTQTILALNYFLLLEHNSERSTSALKIFNEKILGDVSKSETDGIETINLNVSSNTDDSFIAAELSLTMLDASRKVRIKNGKEEMTNQEFYLYKISSFYNILGELKETNSKGLFWNFYIPLFYKVAQSDHMEAFYHFFSSNDEASVNWIKNNENALINFAEWLQKEND